MGDVKKILASCKLKDREKHNSRLFVDLCENIHIHYREYRFIFSLPEFFEFCDIIKKSEEDIRHYLINNQDYKPGKYPTTIIIAGGSERQLKFLENSPAPNRSNYDNNYFSIELQEEYVIDELHIHYRDFRLVLNRDNFKDLSVQFMNAYRELEDFEKSNKYIREKHADRAITSFNTEHSNKPLKNYIQGSVRVKLDKIRSQWYEDIIKEWVPNKQYINLLKSSFQKGETVFPIVLSKEQDGIYKIIDGHHRYYAALISGVECIDAIVTNLTFEESKPIREAEVLLKNFDTKTDNQYRLSDYFKNYMAFSLNDYYKNSFSSLMKSRKNRIVPRIKSLFPFRRIKKAAFKLFYDKPAK